MRFGLFDVGKLIGGPEAKRLLAGSLITTGRGVELAWMASNPVKVADLNTAIHGGSRNFTGFGVVWIADQIREVARSSKATLTWSTPSNCPALLSCRPIGFFACLA